MLCNAGTGYSYARLLKTKNEANNVLIEVITELKTQTKKQVKVLCSDNGGEFANEILSNFLAGKGIIAERLLPYQHYQNGLIECFNWTIAEMGWTILSNSKLLKCFWGHVFQWANHVLNCLPNKTSSEKTPIERMFDQPPRFDVFRVFGSKAYVHIPPENRKKLDDCAYEAFVVGHLEASKGWVFYLPVKKIFASSSMVCFVNILVPSNSMIKPPPFYNPITKQKNLKTEHVLKDGKHTMIQVPEETERVVAPSATFECRVLSNKPVNKMNLGFIANQLELGNFKHEKEFGNQELIIDCILETCNFFGVDIPNIYWQAMKSPDALLWKAAIVEELTNLAQMEVWIPTKLFPSTNALHGQWVFEKKTNADGTPNCFKACFVAKGFKQIAGVNFAENFAPKATFVSL
jgi:hypothetical protein